MDAGEQAARGDQATRGQHIATEWRGNRCRFSPGGGRPWVVQLIVGLGCALMLLVAGCGHSVRAAAWQDGKTAVHEPVPLEGTPAEGTPAEGTPAEGTNQRPVNRELLDASLKLGTQFLLSSQRPQGDFRYHVNFITGENAPEQGLVRQAGALWGLALIHHDHPTEATRGAVLRGIALFQKQSQVTQQQTRFIRHPGTLDGDSGAVALLALTLIDFLRAEPNDQHEALRTQLNQYLNFLVALRRSDQHFYRKYLFRSGEGWGQPSPYFDGEILLALTKAARYAGREDLRDQCLQSAEAMYQAYVKDAVQERRDDPATKGFFQWAAMAFLELYDSRWETTQPYAQRTIDLAHWMIDVHGVLQRRRNTAYAHEGIACAYHLACQIEDAEAAEKFRAAIEQGLAKLTSWQVGGLTASDYLRATSTYDPSCRGGVLGADEIPWLRIDTTQHQMHAVILARRYLWK